MYYAKRTYSIIDQQYVDDINCAAVNAKHKIKAKKGKVPKQLNKRNLRESNDKTEDYIIARDGDEAWKMCKFLGSLLDTENDINREKGPAISV